jgi:hypothetical protein
MAIKADGLANHTVAVQALAASGTALREQLGAGLAKGRLPPPPKVDLELAFFNPGPTDLTFSIDERTEVAIDLQGPRVVTLPATNALASLPIPPQTLPLPAGEWRSVRLTRLVSVSPRGTFYSYWTEPGEYELRVRLRTEVLRGTAGTRRRQVTVTLTSQPLKIRVVGKP